MGRDKRSSVEVLGRYTGPATWVLSSLADGPKHGYALINDIEGFAGVRLQPGTLYAALTRLGASRVSQHHDWTSMTVAGPKARR